MSSCKDILSTFEKVRAVNFGARFYKTDLHFHTPASEDARGKNRYNFNPYKIKYPVRGGDGEKYCNKVKEIQEKLLTDAQKTAAKIVKRFIEEKLSLVAVTDHNAIGTLWTDVESSSGMMDLRSPTWYEIIDDQAQKVNEQAGRKVLTILPGVEISCTGIHILAVFPAFSPRRAVHFVICELLDEIGFSIDEWGRNPKVGKRSVIDAVNLIRQKGGVPIVAHIDGSDQALLKLYKLNSGAMKNVFYNENLSAVEIVKPSRFTRKDKKLKKTVKFWIETLREEKALNSIAYFQGSDAHDLKSIGKRFSFLKMTEPSFSGLKTAITIPSSRVRISQLHKPQTEGLYIYGIEIKNEYFGRQFVRFNRYLNCVTGEKESGKTQIFNLMKKAVNPDWVKVKGDLKLFVEKIVDSKAYHYVFCSKNESDSPRVYSIDRDNEKVTAIDAAELKGLMIEPNFYHPERVKEIISSKNSLEEFLTKHFGGPTKQNLNNFNKMFSLPNFLEAEQEQFLYAAGGSSGYNLCLNVNWHSGKKKMKDFFKLRNSLRRIVVVCIIIVSGGFGPIIIDAPESNFDNKDVADFLVPIMKMYKDFRQIILFTGSPILGVNADPENYVLLNTKDRRLTGITSGFSIDEKSQKGQIVNLMEGGLKSFKKRAAGYDVRPKQGGER